MDKFKNYLGDIVRKVTLVGTTLYSLTFPFPLYANNETNNSFTDKLKTERAIEHTSKEYLYSRYKKTLIKATADGVVNYEEVKELEQALTSYISFATEEIEENLKSEENKEAEASKISETLENKILVYYPSNLSKGQILYEASENLNKRLTEEQIQLVDSLLVKSNSILVNLYKDDRLKQLTEKGTLNIGDLAVFYNIIREEYSLEQSAILQNLRRYKTIYSKYLEEGKTIKRFQNTWDRFWSPYTFASHSTRDEYYTKFKESGINLLEIMKEQGYRNIKLSDIKEDFPSNPKLPPYAAIPLGILGPFILRTLINTYNRRKYEFYDGVDILESIINPICGTFLSTDFIHPYAYFIRLSEPIITEFLRGLNK